MKPIYLWAAAVIAAGAALLAGCGGGGEGGGGGNPQPTPTGLKGRIFDGSNQATIANPTGFQTDVWFFRQDGTTPVKVLGTTKGTKLTAAQAPDGNGILTDAQGSYEIDVESPGANAILVIKSAVTQGGAMKSQTQSVRVVNRALQGESDANFYLSGAVIQGRITDRDGQPVTTDWRIEREIGANNYTAYPVAGGRGVKPDVQTPPLSGGDSDPLGYYNIPLNEVGSRFKVFLNTDTHTNLYDRHEAVLGPLNAGTATSHNVTVADKGSSPTFTNVFSRIASPDLQNGCAKAGCHDGGSIFLPGKMDLRTQASAYAAWVDVLSLENPPLKRVKAGDADNSYVYLKVRDNLMPPGAPLSAEQKALLRDWINAGAPDN
ncbi:MAG: hypothetical protein IT210_08560 [Armatimonadetes bacterium]|nr:hypothetical protein [Armatimonadota bacterium]